MASLSDVAKDAGVSLTTASLVLNRPKQPNRVSEACAQRVRAVAQRLGYIPNYHARSMKLGRAETIVVALDVGDGDGDATVSELSDAYFNQLIGGIELHLRKVGYQLTIVGPDAFSRAPERGMMGVGQRRFDGMIVLGRVVDPARSKVLAQGAEGPVVAIEYPHPTQFPVVDYDERHGVELAVKHLVELGHRDLLWVGSSRTWAASQETSREEMFRSAAARLGARTASCTMDWRPGEVPNARPEMRERAEAAVAKYLREKGRSFTGVVAYNDPVGIGVCGALAAAGVRVPQDVSVVGFDDIEAAFCVPRLTTVSHRLSDMGRKAAERVMEMIGGAGLRGERDVVRPELVVRKSTARKFE
jgi:DNA-binding LacI/PurR family transcriptional regulator